MYVFVLFITGGFVLDKLEALKAKKEDDNMPNQIASLVERKLKKQVHLKVEFSFKPCTFM